MEERAPAPLPAAVPFRRLVVREVAFYLLVALVALVGGAAACAFRALAQQLDAGLFPGAEEGHPGVSDLGTLGRILVPALGGLFAGAIGAIAARQKGGHGIPEIMEAVTLRRGNVSLRATAVKSLAGLVTIVSGGSVGREGPMVQSAAAIASRVGRLLQLTERRVRVLAGAGCAAGIAAAYDAPIGAVVFVAEIVAGTFALDLIVPVMAASTFATAVTRLWFGATPLYRVPVASFEPGVDLAAFAVIGLASGFLGHAFLRALDAGDALFLRLGWPRPVTGMLGGLAVGLIGSVLPQVYGNGFEATSTVLDGRYLWTVLVLILGAKFLATTMTVCSGAPGGVFTPTLLLGACLGGVVGQLLGSAVPGRVGPEGGYALVGMAAMLAATTHAPVLATVMIFEMSGEYEIVMPVLLAAGVAVAVARALAPRSVYTRELARRGVAWEGSIEERLASGVRARDLAREDVLLLPPRTPFSRIRSIFAQTRARSLFVGDAEHGLLGAIDLHAVKLHLDNRDLDSTVVAADLTVPVPSASPDTTLVELATLMHRLDFGDLPIVDRGPPFQLVGVVTRRDLLEAFDREILKRDILVTKVVWRDGPALRSDLLELPPGARVAEVRVPSSLAGRTLREARIRETQGVNVVAVVRGSVSRSEARCTLARPDLVLERGDRLVVITADGKARAA